MESDSRPDLVVRRSTDPPPISEIVLPSMTTYAPYVRELSITSIGENLLFVYRRTKSDREQEALGGEELIAGDLAASRDTVRQFANALLEMCDDRH